MKPINEMTPAEINREIAILQGCDPGFIDRNPCAKPDYCGSWDAAGRLFEEMIAAGLKPLLWWYGGCSTANIAVAYGATCPEAIARCWLAWRRSQDETTH